MKKPNFSTQKNTNTEITLFQVVNQLIKGISPLAISKNSFIVNDIQPELTVNTDVNMLAYVIGSMLNSTVNISNNDCLYISTKIYDNIIIIHIKDNFSTFKNSLAYDLELIQPVAKKLGGSVCFGETKFKGTSIAFSFTNDSMAA